MPQKNEELLLDSAKYKVKNLQSFWSRALRLLRGLRSISVFMFNKMERRTRFQGSPSRGRGSKYLFHLPDVLETFRRAPAVEVGHVLLRSFGAYYLAVDNDY